MKHESSKTQAELETRRPPGRRALLRFEPREEALALRGRRPGCEAAPLGGMRKTLILDGFNVFNIGREVGEYVIGDAQFRTTSLIEPPRTIRVGVRIAF